MALTQQQVTIEEEINDYDEAPVSVYMAEYFSHCCGACTHSLSVRLTNPLKCISVKKHGDGICYFCRTDCCPSCCTGVFYELPDKEVFIMNKDLKRGHSGSVKGRLSDIYMMKSGSFYDSVPEDVKVNLIRIGMQRKWLTKEYFSFMYNYHSSKQHITDQRIVNQGFGELTNIMADFGMFLGTKIQEGFSSLMAVVQSCFRAIVNGLVSSLVGEGSRQLFDKAYDSLADLLEATKETVIVLVTTLVRFMLGYTIKQIFLEIVLHNLGNLYDLSVGIVAFASNILEIHSKIEEEKKRKKREEPEVKVEDEIPDPLELGDHWNEVEVEYEGNDIVDEGNDIMNQGAEELVAPLLSALCMIIYSGASKKNMSVASAVGLNRLVVGMLPKNLDDYLSYFPIINELVTKTTQETAQQSCPGTWEIIQFNMSPKTHPSVREKVELMRYYELCVNERKDVNTKDAFKYFYTKYREFIKMPECLNDTQCLPRDSPYSVVLFGGTSIGKSTQADFLATFILYCLSFYHEEYEHLRNDLYHDLTHPDDTPRVKIHQYVYTFTGVAEHWDGYIGQPIIIMSDFLAAVENKGKSNAENFLRLKDTAPYLLKMASLADKGRFAEPKALILTTNISICAWKSKLEGTCNNPEAYLSRVDDYFEAAPIVATEDGRLDPRPDTDYQCTYIHRKPGKSWNYDLASEPAGWNTVLQTVKEGIKRGREKKITKVMHETRDILLDMFENPDKDFGDKLQHKFKPVTSAFVKRQPKQQQPWEKKQKMSKKEEKKEDTPPMLSSASSSSSNPEDYVENQGWFDGFKKQTFVNPISSKSHRSIPIRGTLEYYDPEDYQRRTFSRKITGIKQYFGVDDRYDFTDYYVPYNQDEHMADECLVCEDGDHNCTNPFECPYLVFKMVRNGDKSWKNVPTDERFYVRKIRNDLLVKGVGIALALGMLVLAYKYYREKTQKKIENMDNVKVLTIGDRRYYRRNIDGPLGRTYGYFEHGSEVIHAHEQKKKDTADMLCKYIPPRLMDKKTIINKNMMEATFGRSEARQNVFAVSEVRFLCLGHYVGAGPSYCTDITIYDSSGSTKFYSKDTLSFIYYKETDLLVVSILSGPRLIARNIIKNFPEEHRKVPTMVTDSTFTQVVTATFGNRRMVSGVQRSNLAEIKIENQTGDCGKPYFFTNDGEDCIAGIHSAGNNHGVAYFIPIIRSMISDAKNQGISLSDPEYIGDPNNEFVKDIPGFISCGKTAFRSNLPSENAHEPIPQLYKDKSEYWKKEYGLCKLNKFIKDGKEYSPAKIRFAKLSTGLEFKKNNPPGKPSNRVVDAIANAMTAHNKVKVPYKPPYDFVIMDNEDLKWVGMDPSKSAGPMINGLKRDLLGNDQKLELWVLEVLNTIERSITEDRVYPSIVRGYTIKDEKLPLEKVQSGMSRLFAPDDAIFYLLCKRFFYRLVTFVNMYGPKIGIMTGMTPEQLGSHFIAIFDNSEGVDADVKSMECGHSHESILLIMNLMIKCKFVDNSGARHNVDPRLPLLSNDALICWVLLNITLYSHCVIADETFRFEMGALGSGSLLTFILNVFVLLMIVGTIYERQGLFHEFCRLLNEGTPDWMLFGDDLTLKLPPDFIREVYKYYGFDCTGADKGEIKSRPFRELTFCGRTFTNCAYVGSTMKLELNRIIKGVQFTKRSKFLEIYPNQVYSFLMELSRHSYDVWRGVLKQFVINGYKLGDYISSKEQYLLMMAEGGSLYEEVLDWTDRKSVV